jgi:hypothetical protein
MGSGTGATERSLGSLKGWKPGHLRRRLQPAGKTRTDLPMKKACPRSGRQAPPAYSAAFIRNGGTDAVPASVLPDDLRRNGGCRAELPVHLAADDVHIEIQLALKSELALTGTGG